MSLNVQELKNSIMTLIKNNDYDIDDLPDFLGPVSEFVDSPNFVNHLKEIVEEIIKDRDGNDKFNIDDLKLLGDDILGITSLVNGVLLVIGFLPEFKLKYEGSVTEDLVFKVFAYIFLVIIPKETNKPWAEDEKEKVVDLILAIYNVIKSSQLTKDLVDKIAKWFKKKGWCKCMGGADDDAKEQVVESHMPQIKAELRSIVQKDKDAARMHNEIRSLRRELDELRSK